LANLSDEELAQLSPEELEQAKQVGANLLAIKKTNREVENMLNQEKWAAAVQQFANEHGISAQEAEDILKKRAGINTPTDMAAIFAAMKPEPNPIEKAISEAIASRISNIAPLLFGNPPANPPGGGSPHAALTEALQQAKAFGAQAIYLPDGTMVKLAGDKDGNQDTILQGATTQIQKYVEDILNQRLPSIFNPQPPGMGMPQLGNNPNPEVARLVFEDKWKEEDRRAADARATGRDSVLRDIAAVVGAAFSPEGFAKVQKLLKEGPTGAIGAGKKAETKTEGKMLKMTCWQCMRVFPYEEGQDPVCPYCGQAQKVQCPKCENIFIPKNKNKIVCPNCHAELQTKPEEQSKQPPAEKVPEESPGPAVSVGLGLE
jgi:Zn finger protein HypA/HybF involved in hydrogenase expression